VLIIKIKNLIKLDIFFKLTSVGFSSPALNFKICKLKNKCNEYYEFVQNEQEKIISKLQIEDLNNPTKEQFEQFNFEMEKIFNTDITDELPNVVIADEDIEDCCYTNKEMRLTANEWNAVLDFLEEVNKHNIRMKDYPFE